MTSGGKDTVAIRSSVDATALVDGSGSGDDAAAGAQGTAKRVKIDNLIGVLFDRDAAMVCNEEPEVRSQYNADGNFTNFFYNYDCSFYNDFDENAVVFVWGTTTQPT